MANRVSITNEAEFESAISTQKEIGREQYHNYLKSQFDENISDELKRLYEWREQAILNDDSFTVQDINKEIEIVKMIWDT